MLQNQVIGLRKILVGFKNALYTNPRVKKLAAERMTVCNICEHKMQKASIEICDICKCILRGKTRSPRSKCPANRWKN